MTIVSCPRCADQVTVPTQAGPEAVVRCPLCNEEYALSEALRGVPPMLIVVDPGIEVTPAPLDTMGELQLEPTTTAKPFVFEERAAPRRVAARPRPQRREKNLFVEIFKIVAGGVVGLSIGQLILWWVPGLHISQRDPIDLGAKLSPYVPWIIPAALRSSEFEDETVLAHSEQRTQRRSRRTAGRQNENRSSAAPSTRVHDQGDLSHAPIDSDLGSSRAGVRNPPRISSDEFMAALADAQSQWEEASRDPKSREFQAAFVQLARCVTFADPADEDVQGAAEAARGLLREMSGDPATLESLLSAVQPDISPQSYPGRIISGTIESVERAGQLFLTTLATSNGSANVVSTVDPRTTVSKEDAVVILGVGVSKPRTQLEDYEGLDEPVVFGGLLVKMRHQASAAGSEQPEESDPATTDLESDPTTESVSDPESQPETASESDNDSATQEEGSAEERSVPQGDVESERSENEDEERPPAPPEDRSLNSPDSQ